MKIQIFSLTVLTSFFLTASVSAFAADWQCGQLKDGNGWLVLSTGFGVKVLPANEPVDDFIKANSGTQACVKGNRLNASQSADFLVYAIKAN